jgi:SAM-dependent methyltransferase
VRGGRIASRRDVTDAAIVEAVLRHAPRRLLDIGCGEGWLCRALSDHVAEVTGVDGSPELIAQAKSGGGAEFHAIDYERLLDKPETTGTGFDTIVCNFALLDDRTGALLSALADIAIEHGHLIIQTVHPLLVPSPYVDGWRVERFEGFGEGQWAEMPWHFHTLGRWITMLSTRWQLMSLEEPRKIGAETPASLLMTTIRKS